MKRRHWIILSIAPVIPAGLACKWFPGTGAWWFNDYGAGVLYEIFWCLVIFSFWPRKKNAWKIALGVFAATCLLEVLQLWHGWESLEQVRRTFLGRTLLGTTFAGWDFPHYALGCTLGWFWMKILSRSDSKPH